LEDGDPHRGLIALRDLLGLGVREVVLRRLEVGLDPDQTVVERYEALGRTGAGPVETHARLVVSSEGSLELGEQRLRIRLRLRGHSVTRTAFKHSGLIHSAPMSPAPMRLPSPGTGREPAPLDPEATAVLRELFETIVLCRRFEEAAAKAYGMGRIGGFCH